MERGACLNIRAFVQIQTCTLSGLNLNPGPTPKQSLTRLLYYPILKTPLMNMMSVGTYVLDRKCRARTGQAEMRCGQLRPRAASAIAAVFCLFCAGYYDYDKPHNPELTGQDNFKGPIIHPQHWPEDLDYKDKNVVVIGSGATAVTIIPAMAKQTKHITMLQRSPTWILPQPEKDWFANLLLKFLPEKWAYKLARRRNILRQSLIYKWSIQRPERMKKVYLNMIRKSLDLDSIDDIPEHFIPKYNPWTQRLCVVPDGDLYESVKAGDASVVTDHIETITESGITLKSGQHLDCDIIIKSTGISLTCLLYTSPSPRDRG